MEMTSTHHRERVVATLVLADWYIQQGLITDDLPIDTLVTLYHEDLEQAAKKSTEVLLALKKACAVSAPEFGISETMFLRLGITGKSKSACQMIWYPQFDAIFDRLGIHDQAERHAYVFSGLGYESLRLCVVVYDLDWNEAFVFHEYLHVRYKGFSNTFFDEMITESLAYARCAYVDLVHYTIAPLQSMIDWGINVDYYDALVYFLSVCKSHPTLFPYLRKLYETGDGSDSGLDYVAEIIGDDHYQRLVATDPSSHALTISPSTNSDV